MRAKIHPPIETIGKTMDDKLHIKQQVRDIILTELQK
jgi:hypothetical protein